MDGCHDVVHCILSFLSVSCFLSEIPWLPVRGTVGYVSDRAHDCCVPPQTAEAKQTLFVVRTHATQRKRNAMYKQTQCNASSNVPVCRYPPSTVNRQLSSPNPSSSIHPMPSNPHNYKHQPAYLPYPQGSSPLSPNKILLDPLASAPPNNENYRSRLV